MSAHANHPSIAARASYSGVASVMAMLYLVLMGTLVAATLAVSSLNTRTAYNYSDVNQAALAAESGLRYFAYHVDTMANRPMPIKGKITAQFAWDNLWGDSNNMGAPIKGLTTCIQADLGTTVLPSANIHNTGTDHSLITNAIKLDTLSNGAQFTLEVIQNGDGRILTVISKGTYRNAVRAIRMNFWMDKRLDAAVMAWTPPQLGKNVLLQGNLRFNTRKKKTTEGTIIQSLSDFRNRLGTGNDTKLAAFQQIFISGTDGAGADNNIRGTDSPAWAAAAQLMGVANPDLNGDGVVNEYDLFLKLYDTKYSPNDLGTANGPRISRTDYSTFSDYDANLFSAIDHIPHDLKPMDAAHGGGYNDGYIDNLDQYAKILGKVTIVNTGYTGAPPMPRNEFEGPIINPDGAGINAVNTVVPPAGSADDSEAILNPANYETACNSLIALTQGTAGKAADGFYQYTTIDSKMLANSTPRATRPDSATTDPSFPFEFVQVDTPGTSGYSTGQVVDYASFKAKNAGLSGSNKATFKFDPNWTLESTPYGSGGYGNASDSGRQVIFKRPVFRNINFRNCTIPKGLQAVFVNCTFDGVTYVQTDRSVNNNSTDPNSQPWLTTRTDGKAFDKNANVCLPNSADAVPPTKYAGVDVSTNGSNGFNNIRFDGCTFTGPLVGNYSTAFAHGWNCWEFSGNTNFNNQWVDANGDTTVSMLSPQVNIEMGSFTSASQTSIKIKGVVVVGNFDVRGTGWIDGACINTGDGAGNMTLGYFGDKDSSSTVDLSDITRAGYLNIRYNPMRPLPDGILIPVSIKPDPTTYLEVQP